MRKQRRRIKRRKRKRNKFKRKNWLDRHLDSPPSNRWTKNTTYILIMLEITFVIWYLQETMLNWQEILMKLRNIIDIIGKWFI